MGSRVSAFLGALACVLGVLGPADLAAGQTAQMARDEVAKELARDSDFRPVSVTLDEEGRIVLAGEVRLLWTKDEAVRRATRAADEHPVIDNLTVRTDDVVAEAAFRAVERAIRNYEYLTVFDYVSGSMRDGVVTITGEVTSVRDISGDLVERVSKVRGVREIRNELQILPPFTADDEIRSRLARAIFSRPSFEPFAGMSNPPFRLIVRNGIVTLRGYVDTRAEYLEMQQIASQIPGIVRIENRLEILR